jgi:hypothetical protein
MTKFLELARAAYLSQEKAHNAADKDRESYFPAFDELAPEDWVAGLLLPRPDVEDLPF